MQQGKDFRASYLHSLGRHGVLRGAESPEAVKRFQALLQGEASLPQLRRLCQQCPMPASYRARVWALVLGVDPLIRDARPFVAAQKEETFNDIYCAARRLANPSCPLPEEKEADCVGSGIDAASLTAEQLLDVHKAYTSFLGPVRQRSEWAAVAEEESSADPLQLAFSFQFGANAGWGTGAGEGMDVGGGTGAFNAGPSAGTGGSMAQTAAAQERRVIRAEFSGLFLSVCCEGKAGGQSSVAFWCLDAFLRDFEHQFGETSLESPRQFWGQWRAYLDLHAQAAAAGEPPQHTPPPPRLQQVQQEKLQQQQQLQRGATATRALRATDVDAILLALAQSEEQQQQRQQLQGQPGQQQLQVQQGQQGLQQQQQQQQQGQQGLQHQASQQQAAQAQQATHQQHAHD